MSCCDLSTGEAKVTEITLSAACKILLTHIQPFHSTIRNIGSTNPGRANLLGTWSKLSLLMSRLRLRVTSRQGQAKTAGKSRLPRRSPISDTSKQSGGYLSLSLHVLPATHPMSLIRPSSSSSSAFTCKYSVREGSSTEILNVLALEREDYEEIA